MLCEDYSERLTEAAATGVVASFELQSHLDGCAACRAFFEKERQLFATIDSGVRVAANAEAPPSLLPLVRAALSDDWAPWQSKVPAWLVVAGATVLILMFIPLGIVRRGLQPPGSVAKEGSPMEHKEIPPPSNNEQLSAPMARNTLPRRPRPESAATVVQAAVLVPPAQKAAMDSLILNLRKGKADGRVLLSQDSESPLEELRIVPIEVSPIIVKPLEEENGESARTSSPTNR